MIRGLGRILLISLLSTLCACATTKLTRTWVNPAYQGKRFHRILVLGVRWSETYLRIFEDAMCRELKKRGVQAEPGYTLFPPGKRPDNEAISKEIAGQGFDAMIISQVAGKRTATTVHPNYPQFFGPPNYELFTYKVVTMHSNMYDTATNALVWRVTSETVVEGKPEDLINSLAKALIKGMAAKGLI